MTAIFDRLVFAPTVDMIGFTKLNFDGLSDAIENAGVTDIAETEGTPLNNLLGEVLRGEADFDTLAEFAGRQCYRSWAKGRSKEEYIANVIEQAHGSIFEHAVANFQVTGVSRTLTHELIRHRVGTAYSQESQRYVDAKDIRFVVPPLLLAMFPNMDDWRGDTVTQPQVIASWLDSCAKSLIEYENVQAGMLKQKEFLAERFGEPLYYRKRVNEAARSVLPGAAETRMLFSCNMREMLHLLTLRGDEPADLEIRRFAVSLLGKVKQRAPLLFKSAQVAVGSDKFDAIVAATKRI